VVVDAVARFVPGVVGDARSVDDDSFVRGLFDHPHFTRPAVIDAHAVPDVLLSGHHGEIRRWRKREALKRTLARRPDLLDAATLDGEDREILEALKSRVREE
jgi:tRNA (guanine37-N1)-methyltransferase